MKEKKRQLKGLAALLVLCLVLQMAACGAQGQSSAAPAEESKSEEAAPASSAEESKEESKEEAPAEESKEEEAPAEESEEHPLWISDEPITFTFFHSPSEAEDGEWLILKEAAKMTNVDLHITLSKSNSDYLGTLNSMIASGDMDDIIMSYWANDITKYGVDGAFIALDEHFDVMPNIKKFFDENPEIRRAHTSYDGHIYYISLMLGGVASRGWFFRTDWLNKLGLEAPKTKEELYDVLVAFRDQDPNGNGEKDEVPYFNGFMSADGFSGLECLYCLWGAQPSWYRENDVVKYGPVQPEFKEAISNIAQWYAEGLIDKEIFTRGSSARADLLGNNVGGSTQDWFGSTAKFNFTLPAEIEGFEFRPYAPVEGIEYFKRAPIQSYGWCITSSCKDVEAACKYFDFWFTEEGNRLINYGIEGVHYDMVDGKPTFKQEILDAENPQAVLQADGVQLEMGYKQDFEYEKQWVHPYALDAMNEYVEKDYFMDQFPTLTTYNEDEFDRYTELYTAIKTYVYECVQKWILGVSDVNAEYDGFVEQLQKMGVDEMIEYQQHAYDNWLKF